jgi:predicted lipid-binding transport protein (Tim44 family)
MKKIYVGIFALFAIALLGVGVVSAFGMGQGKMLGLDEEDKAEMQEFHNSIQEAIQAGDYETWKTLMESRINPEVFEQIQARWAEREAHREEMQEAFESGEMPRGQGYGMHKGGMRGMNSGNFGNCPFADAE